MSKYDDQDKILEYIKDKLSTDLYTYEILLDRLEEETGEDPERVEFFNEVAEINNNLKGLKSLI